MALTTDFILGICAIFAGIFDLGMAVYFLRFRDTSQLNEEQLKANKVILAMLSGIGLLFTAFGFALISGAVTLQDLLSRLG